MSPEFSLQDRSFPRKLGDAAAGIRTRTESLGSSKANHYLTATSIARLLLPNKNSKVYLFKVIFCILIMNKIFISLIFCFFILVIFLSGCVAPGTDESSFK